MRSIEIRARVDRLVGSFDRYLSAFDEAPAFKKTGQYENHAAAVGLRMALGSASAAIADDNFLRLLWLTLRAWGIGSRGSQLLDLGGFTAEIRAHQQEIEVLDSESIDSAGLNIDAVSASVWRIVQSLSIVRNNAKLVPCSKALHHILPDLVVPMDRMFTRSFYGWHVPEFQYDQERIFHHAFREFVRIARATNPGQYVGQGWRTSRTKVLDNALVGFCRVERLQPPS
jgi:hypothetical protein